jgi:hypothetical protein
MHRMILPTKFAHARNDTLIKFAHAQDDASDQICHLTA